MNKRFGGPVTAVSALMLTGLASLALGQTGGDSNQVVPTLSWQEMWNAGGWLMYVLAAMSVLAVALIFYFFSVLRVDQVAPTPLLRALIDAIRHGSFDEARRTCESRPCPLAAVALVALDYQRDTTRLDPRMLQDLMEGEGSRQADNIQGQPQYLMDIAVLSPMVGLLGSVFGMMHAFNVVALDVAKAKPLMLATGVSQALICTAFGLLIGIPAMGFYGHFRRRSALVVSTLESASTSLLTTLVGKTTP